MAACNPFMLRNGFKRCSKIDMLGFFPRQYVPKTILVRYGTPFEKALERVQAKGLTFPLICKPNHGERGHGVQRVHSQEEMQAYLAQTDMDVMVQEYLDYKYEVGVLYYRYPGQEMGDISSISIKDLLHVEGDGVSTAEQLLENDALRSHHLERLRKENHPKLKTVPAKNEWLQLDYIGQQNRGCLFFDANHLYSKALVQKFDRVSKHFEGFYYGRYDLKVNDLNKMQDGEFKILEVNLTASMPIHIFDPKHGLSKCYGDFLKHWRIVFEISRENHRRGTPFISFSQCWNYCKARFHFSNPRDEEDAILDEL